MSEEIRLMKKASDIFDLLNQIMMRQEEMDQKLDRLKLRIQELERGQNGYTKEEDYDE